MNEGRAYEALAIFKSFGTEAEMAGSVKQLEDPIQKLGGSIDRSTSWGRRRLAYRIARQQEGVYHLVQFQLPPPQLEELKHLLRLNENIVRFLILNRADARGTDWATASPMTKSAEPEGVRGR